MTRPNFFEHLHPPTIPAREARFQYTFGLGGMSLLLFLTLIVTGVPLMFVYVPTAATASDAIRAITYVAPFGWLLRNLHYWAGQLLVVSLTLHLLRVVMTGSYKPPRRFNWTIGVTLLTLTLLINFTGYVLRWDVDTNGALTVATNIVRQLPLLGNWLYELLLGGPLIGNATVVRFYTWHTLGLSVPLLIFIGWHLFRVRRDGGISHTNDNQPMTNGKAARISRRTLVQREGLAMLALLCLLFGLALFFDAPLATPVDVLAGPETAVSATLPAPWFFRWIQALLRIWPPQIAGLLIPTAVFLLLLFLPWLLDRTETGTAVYFNQEGRTAQIVVLGLFGVIILLTLIEWWQ